MSIIIITALRYLAARKMRAVLTTLAVVFGVAVIFAGNLILPSALDSYRRSILGAVGEVDLSIAARGGATFAPQPALAQVQGVSGVQAATGVLQQAVPLPAQEGQLTAQLVIVGVEPETIQQVRSITVAQGRFLQAGDQGVAVLSEQEAREANLKLNDPITLPTVRGLQTFTLVGLFDAGPVPSNDVLMTLADAQELLGAPNQISQIEVALVPGVNREMVMDALLARVGAGYQPGSSSALDAVGTMDVAYAMFNMFGALALFIGAFLIFNTFRTIVLERRRDLAMLRAIGAERRQVISILLFESLLQGLIGSMLGLLVGAGFAVAVARAAETIGASYMPGLSVAITPSFEAALPALIAGIATTLLAAYLPARAAGRVSPLEALRPASALATRRANRWSLVVGLVLMLAAVGLLLAGTATAALGAILFLVGLATISPALVVPLTRLFSPLLRRGFAGESEIAVGNIERQPGRAAVTASTLMIGLAVLVMLTSVVGSFSVFVRDLYTRNFASDLLLFPQNIAALSANLGADPQLAEDIRALPEVATVGTLRTASGVVGDTTITIQGIEPVSYSQVSALSFQNGDPAQAYAALESGRAIVNPVLAQLRNFNVGDSITVTTPNGNFTYTVAAIGSDALNFKINTLFVSQATMARDFGKTQDVALMVRLAPGADVVQAQAKVEQVAAGYAQFTVRNTAEFRNSLIDQTLLALRGGFLPLGIVIMLPAALGLLNTLTMNVLERTREIGIVRAIGASQGQVRRIVLAESLLLGLFGAAFGVLAGIALSYGFVQALGSGFGSVLPYSFPAFGVLLALVVGIVLTLLISVLPARSASRLDILRALRYE